MQTLILLWALLALDPQPARAIDSPQLSGCVVSNLQSIGRSHGLEIEELSGDATGHGADLHAPSEPHSLVEPPRVRPGTPHVQEGTMFMPAPAPPARGPPTVELCCAKVPRTDLPQLPPEWTVDREVGNPYYSGPAELYDPHHPPVRMVSGEDYVYHRPDAMGGHPAFSKKFEYEIPPKRPFESDPAYSSRRLDAALQPPPGKTAEDVSTYIGGGSQSRVYLVHPPAPDGAALKALYSDEAALRAEFKMEKATNPSMSVEEMRRLKWARANSTDVIKLRTPLPWGRDLEAAARTMRRDLVMQGEFKEAAGNFKYLGDDGTMKPIVRVVGYTQSEGEAAQGILRQPLTRGPDAWTIRFKIGKALRGGAEGQEAEAWLQAQGFRNEVDAERKLAALEEFYQNTHEDAVAFEMKNDLTIYSNSSKGGKRTVGFDFNHGSNVSWNAKDGIFEAFDF